MIIEGVVSSTSSPLEQTFEIARLSNSILTEDAPIGTKLSMHIEGVMSSRLNKETYHATGTFPLPYAKYRTARNAAAKFFISIRRIGHLWIIDFLKVGSIPVSRKRVYLMSRDSQYVPSVRN